MEKRAWIGGGAFLACAILFGGIVWSIPDAGPLAIDREAADAIQSLTGKQGEQVWKAVTNLGSSLIIVAVALLYSIWFGLHRRTWAALYIPAAGIVAYACNQLLKGWVDRPRPLGAWGIEVDGASFPSGNAMLAMAVYGTIALSFVLYAIAGRAAKWIASIIGIICIASVGFSRLFFGVHYLSDIVAGYAAGALVMLLALHLVHYSLHRNN
ncbi:undecaprenyl-diphosphatase [Paenibacillus cellulosilyticus]|uniref:Undecaprenyl-diphosphatase n=1 Tax=Paenibacillus cellulosilyticus TaxID=375489 RepID=A0A2V2Z4S5_9BACL|nr:phosphatase PAP2 family protein [Paenibacillus cellulosilyticus]PWW05469.1 undecaprenyl-diphosphatase [Paenibacillus cellulosilyticus]QKS45490.1 phosphatase PAP2 family protein [Paenibacillus cellulosilyticus]